MRSFLYEVRIERLIDVGRVDIVPGFFAITRSPQLREMLARVVDLGAVVTAAVHRSLLIGYAADLPFLPIKLEHGEWKRRWQLLPDARELGGIESRKRGTPPTRRPPRAELDARWEFLPGTP